MRLQHRLSLAILPAILGPLLIIGAISYQQLRDMTQRKTLENMHIAADQLSDGIRNDVAAKAASVQFLAIASPLSNYVLSTDETTRYGLYQPNVLALFSDYQVAYADNRELRLLKPDGATDIEWLRDQGSSLASTDLAAFVDELRRLDSVPLLHVLRPAKGGGAMLIVGTRLGNGAAERRTPRGSAALGYLVAVFDLRAAMSNANVIRFGASGGVIITDANGRPWSDAERARSWTSTANFSAGLRGQRGEQSVAELDTGAGKRFITVRSPNPELRVVASMDSGEVSRAGMNIALIVGVLILVSLAGMHLLVYGTVNGVLLAPVQKLIGMARSMAGGNLTAAVPLDASGELADLGRSLSDLASGLARSQQESAAREKERERAMQAFEAARTRAETASRAKSEFLARMSHEIRTPMNGVLGMTELLRATPLDERQRRFVQLINHSADSMLAIINDVLDFSKIEAGKLELDNAPFDLGDVVEEAVELFAEQATKKGLELACDVSPALHRAYRGDALRLRQILINLVGNAIKFTEKGAVFVGVEERASAANACELRFEVRDTGIGIKSDSQQTIFDSFSQEDGSTTRKYGGTGLGLSICKRLVELMRGEIGVDSEPGGGSTFHFSVTLEREPGSARASDRGALPPARILIVAHHAFTREILSAQLTHWKLQVSVADSGAQALELLQLQRANPVDVVLLERHMPVMDGMSVVGALQSDSRLRALPVIMMASTFAGGLPENPQSPGVAAWLNKPVRRAVLRDCLKSVLNGSPAQKSPPPDRLCTLQPSGALGGRVVLLVEDNPVNQELASEMLAILGATVVNAWNGEDALARLEERQFDVVLLDCQMPDVDGYQVSRRWRAREAAQPRQRRTPIIALTANALQGAAQKCLDAGMDDYLAKPFTFEELRGALDAQLQGHLGATPSDEPLDRKALDALSRIDAPGAASLREKVVQVYLQSAGGFVHELSAALATGDFGAAGAAASALKSGSADVGAVSLIDLCTQLEAAIRASDPAAAGKLGRRLTAEYDRAVAALTTAYGNCAA
jgi:two-component system, sensor histidine kinase and response regulator